MNEGAVPGGAVFLDRDGVINRRLVGAWVREPSELEVLPGALEAIALLTEAGRAPVVVTNQSGIGRGTLEVRELERVHQHLRALVGEAGGRLGGIYVCPHRPTEGCSCRKPSPGLLIRAARELEIDLGRATLIGDAASDIGAARSAGLARALLVPDPTESYPHEAPAPDHVFPSLLDAVTWLLAVDR